MLHVYLPYRTPLLVSEILWLLVGLGLEGSRWQAFGQIAARCRAHTTQLCISGTVQYGAEGGIGSG